MMPGRMSNLDTDLYRSLRAEAADYHGKLQSLWLQKLTLSGAVGAFVVIQADEIVKLQPVSPVLIGVALALLLAITIDFKVLEYGLHVRAISRFIVRTCADREGAADWEAVLWGDKTAPERPLVLARNALTVLSAAMPTLALLAITCWLFAHAWGRWEVWLAGAGIAIGYGAMLIWSGRALFRQARTG